MEQYLTQENIREGKRVASRVKEIFKKEGEEIQDDEIAQLKIEAPKPPDFPIIIVTLSIIKDLLDIPGDLSVVGIILTTLTSFLVSCILTIWTFNKISGGWWKKRMIRWLWTRLVLAMIIEYIPYFKMIPTNTIFILMAHYRETKLVRLFNLALEEMHNLEKKGKLRIDTDIIPEE